MVRKGFTLIELIFSIVVISIIVGFYPILSKEVGKSIEHAVEQNALFATTTRMSKMTTAYWDDTSYLYDPLTFTFSPSQIITAANTHTQLAEVGATGNRIGAFGGANRRFFRTGANATNYTAGFLGFEGGDFNIMGTSEMDTDDVDDFDTNTTFVTIFDTTNATSGYGYKENIWMNVRVQYVSDDPSSAGDYNATTVRYDYPTATAGANLTNIKMTTIQTRRFIPDEGNVTIFTMRAYSSNIGEIQQFKTGDMP